MRLILLLLVFAFTVTAKSKQPNIIYIMSENHTAHPISAYRGRLAELKQQGYNTAIIGKWHLKNDPQELNNRYNDPKYSDIIIDLKAELKRQREELNETDINYTEIQTIVDKHWYD